MLIKIESSNYLDGFADLSGSELEVLTKILAKVRKYRNEHLDKAYMVDNGETFDVSMTVVSKQLYAITRQEFDGLHTAFQMNRKAVRSHLVTKMVAEPDDRSRDQELFNLLEEHSLFQYEEKGNAYVFGGTANTLTLKGTGYNDKTFELTLHTDGMVSRK
jgi:hypothetical protein